MRSAMRSDRWVFRDLLEGGLDPWPGALESFARQAGTRLGVRFAVSFEMLRFVTRGSPPCHVPGVRRRPRAARGPGRAR